MNIPESINEKVIGPKKPAPSVKINKPNFGLNS
jgi:hypothetical protein